MAADVAIGSGGVVSLSLSGAATINSILASVPGRADRLLATALYQEANDILNTSMNLVPVRRGTLRASADISLPRVTSNSVEVTFGYGGAASAYAVVQHESTSYRHAPGRGPKFLEQPAIAAAADLDRRLAARLSSLYGGR